MQRKINFNTFLVSSAAERRKNSYEIHINAASNDSVLSKLARNTNIEATTIHIWGGANPNITRYIPTNHTKVYLRDGADKAIAATLPKHIIEVEIYPHTDASALANLPPTVERVTFTGVSESIIASLPTRYKKIALRNDISPAVMASIPECVKTIYLVGPIAAGTLKNTPPAVHTIYFNENSFDSDYFADDRAILRNTGRLLLNAIPHSVKAIGIEGNIHIDILKLLPRRFRYLMIKNNSDVDLAATIPAQITKILIDANTTMEFVRAIPRHVEIFCQDNVAKEIKDYANGRNTELNRLLDEQTARTEKRSADATHEDAPSAKRPRLDR